MSTALSTLRAYTWPMVDSADAIKKGIRLKRVPWQSGQVTVLLYRER